MQPRTQPHTQTHQQTRLWFHSYNTNTVSMQVAGQMHRQKPQPDAGSQTDADVHRMTVDIRVQGWWMMGMSAQFAQHSASVPHMGWGISDSDGLCGGSEKVSTAQECVLLIWNAPPTNLLPMSIIQH